MDSAFWGLIGTLVGALASVGTTWLASASAQRVQRSTAKEERIERARAFQRQTLLDLQDAIHDSMRLATKAHLEDRKAVHAGITWGRNMLSDDLDESIRVSQRKVAILCERIESDELRAQIKDLMSTAHNVLLAATEGDAIGGMRQFYADGQKVLEGVGAELRNNYRGCDDG